MNAGSLKQVSIVCALALAFATAGTAALASDAGDTGKRAAASGTSDIPLVNWNAPQLFNPERGVSGSLAGFHTPSITSKAALSLNTFVPIAPCRLVDTRGAFSPVYAGGAFAANEVRVYRSAGNCGVPAGNSRVKAVSLAVTTPPTAASGDIEILSESATLGGTVVMVIQAAQWNSATTVSAVDGEGDFKVQLRSTPGHVVIDINGYYASTSDVNSSDYISIMGTYSLGGGLLYIYNSSPGGSAINADGPLSNARLAAGPDAAVLNGGLKVPNAGINTDDFMYVHRTTASNSCVVGGLARTVLDHPDLNGNPDNIPHVGLPIYAWPGGTSGAEGEAGPFRVLYYLGAATCGSVSMLNKWTIATTTATPITTNVAFPVMVVKP